MMEIEKLKTFSTISSTAEIYIEINSTIKKIDLTENIISNLPTYIVQQEDNKLSKINKKMIVNYIF